MIAWTHCGTLPPIGHRRAGLENDAECVEEPEAPDASVGHRHHGCLSNRAGLHRARRHFGRQNRVRRPRADGGAGVHSGASDATERKITARASGLPAGYLKKSWPLDAALEGVEDGSHQS